MSKSTSCFPSLKCLGKRKNSSFLKIKTQINMPTMREFLYRNNNAGTQTTVCYSEKVNSNESLQLRPRLQNPGSYRSTIAILHNRNFVPLSNSESDKKLSISKFQSPDISILPSHPQRLPNNSTVLMSRGSFDAFFANSQAEKKESEKIPPRPILMNCSCAWDSCIIMRSFKILMLDWSRSLESSCEEYPCKLMT